MSFAGSPPRAHSPPTSYLSATTKLNPPHKRPALNTSNTTSSAKRRKASATSAISSAHPLRQTSFPPPESALVNGSRASSFSPGVEDLIASRSSVGRKRGRGGKKAAANEARSQAATSASGARKGNNKSNRGSQANGAEADEPEDDEDEDEGAAGENTVLEGGAAPDEAQKQLERENMRLLVEAFSRDQSDRYDMWRRMKLNKAVVRRLVNQTLSQSVPASVVTTVSGYTKLFVGEIIERALTVQEEWLAAAPLLPIDQPRPSTDDKIPLGVTETVLNEDKGHKVKAKERVHERDKGPLQPDHLREALRRYKRDRDGHGTGVQGLSLNGRAKTASRVGGRRMFR